MHLRRQREYQNRKRQVGDYKEYLKSDEWQRVRNKLLANPYSSNCYFCDAKRIDFHHVTYLKMDRGKYILPVCRECHTKIHRYENEKDITIYKATTRWANVCGVFKPNKRAISRFWREGKRLRRKSPKKSKKSIDSCKLN